MKPAIARNRLRARKAAQALILWESVVLVGIGSVTALAIWHLRRRSRIIRENFRPTRLPAESLQDIAQVGETSHDDEAPK